MANPVWGTGPTIWYVWPSLTSMLLCAFMFNDFSDAFVFRRGGYLRWISKIFNQLIFSLSSGLFLLPAYYCICGTFLLSWLKYCDPNIRKLNILRSYHCMYYVLCTIVLFWQIIHSYFYGTINESIFSTLYVYAYMMTSFQYCAL